MKDTKLVSLLKNLSGEDLRQVRKMLISPFYTTNANLLALFNVLKAYHPNYASRKLEKKVVFKKMFPAHDYSDIKLRNLNSDLVRIIEDYLIYKSINTDKLERQSNLIKIYKKRGYLDWFEREANRLTEELNKLPFRDQIYYQKYLDLTILQLEHYEGEKMEARYLLLEKWKQLLNQYYELSKARQRFGEFTLKVISTPLDQKTASPATKPNIQLALYQQIEQLYRSEDMDLFEKIREEIEIHLKIIRPKYQRELILALINFAIKQMAKDDEKYNKFVLELYQLALKYNLLFESHFSDAAFFNIVVCGSKARSFEWTSQFINDYQDKLFPETKDDILTLSLSTYHFHKKEYAKAIELIRAHSFKHEQIKATGKYHAIRCYYELYLLDSTYYDLLIAQLDSNERYFRRVDNLPEEKLRSSLNFWNFIRKLATMRLSGKLKAEQKKQMIEELSKQKITLSRSWLIDIINR